MAEKLIKKLNNREFYAKYSDYAAMDEDGERLSDRKVKSVSLDAASGTMTVTNTDGSQDIPVVPVPDQEGKVLKSNADGTYAWGAAGAEPGSGKLYVKFGSAPEVDTNFNANSDSKVTLVIPLATAEVGNHQDGLMSYEDKDLLYTVPGKLGGLDDRISTIENDYVTSQDLQSALSPIESEVDSLGGQVGSLTEGKADKVSQATSGNLASLDANGDLDDSGISGSSVSAALTKLSGIAPGAQVNVIEGVKLGETALNPESKVVTIPLFNGSANGAVNAPASEYRTDEYFLNGIGGWSKVDLSEYIQKVSAGTAGNLPVLTSGGGLDDSGVAASGVETAVQNSHSHSNKEVLDEIPARSGTDSAMLYSADDSSSIAWKNWSYVTVSKKTTNSVLIGKNWYPYVKIGNLYWTTENLREPIGTKNTDYWVYDENTVIERGYIYKHDTVIKGQSGVESDALLALLHDGWRIPTLSDASDLLGQPGPYWVYNGYEFFATDAARITPDTGVTGFTDTYGFHAYPSGVYRASGYGFEPGFYMTNTNANFYTKTPYNAAGQVNSFYVCFPNGSYTAGRGDGIGGETGLYCCVRLCKSAT